MTVWRNKKQDRFRDRTKFADTEDAIRLIVRVHESDEPCSPLLTAVTATRDGRVVIKQEGDAFECLSLVEWAR